MTQILPGSQHLSRSLHRSHLAWPLSCSKQDANQSSVQGLQAICKPRFSWRLLPRQAWQVSMKRDYGGRPLQVLVRHLGPDLPLRACRLNLEILQSLAICTHLSHGRKIGRNHFDGANLNLPKLGVESSFCRISSF